MNRSRHNFSPAFTLIELVLAMAMVAVVAVSLYSTLHVAFRVVTVSDNVLEPTRTADLAMELIAADLQNAISPNTTITNAINTTSTLGSTATSTPTAAATATATADNTATTGYVLSGAFEGTQSQGNGGQEGDDLVLYTTADAPDHVDGTGEIKNVELTLETPQGSQTQCLVRRVIGNLTSEQQVTPDEEILCRGVTSFALTYFDGSQWQPTWDSTQQDNTLPAAVQVTLTLDRPRGSNAHAAMVYTRVFPLSCSTAALDTTVNTGASGL